MQDMRSQAAVSSGALMEKADKVSGALQSKVERLAGMVEFTISEDQARTKRIQK